MKTSRLPTTEIIILALVTIFWAVGIADETVSQPKLALEERDTLRGLKRLRVVTIGIAECGLSEQAVQAETELRLRESGIDVASAGESQEQEEAAFLYVSVTGEKADIGVVMTVAVELAQMVRLSRDTNIICVPTTWSKRSVNTRSNNIEAIRDEIENLVSTFVTDYLAVNPQQVNAIVTPAVVPEVQSIGMDPDHKYYAIASNSLVYEGDRLNGYVVRKIHADRIEFRLGEKIFVQKLN
jgi:hypothetical protein